MMTIGIRSLPLVTALTISSAACTQPDRDVGTSFDVAPTEPASVALENPTRGALLVTWIDGPSAPSIRIPAGESRVELELQSGRYQVEMEPSGLRVPLPALVEVLDGAAFPLVRLTPAPSTGPDDHVWIPGGPALIGDTLGVGAEDERPARIVDVAGLWMGKREVTNGEYTAFLTDQTQFDRRWIDLGSRKCRIEPPQAAGGDYRTDAPALPVVMVSHSGATAYCEWLTEKRGARHRLPTEVEWEKAARGPGSFTYAYGDVYTQAMANQESGVLRPVASFPPNGFGLHDMTGNVFEWMGNEYDRAAIGASMNQALRGGSYVLDGMYLRNSFRMRQSRSVMTDDIGFRTVCEAR